MMKVADVAERLNCSLSTAYALIEQGKIPHYRCPGIRVSEAQLADYLESTKRGRNPAPWPEKTRPMLKHLR